MSFKSMILGLGALASLYGVAVANDGVAGDDWSRFQSPDEAFSVKTPCSAEETLAFQAMTKDASILPVPIGPEARVMCLQGETLMFAGIVEVPLAELGDTSLFDLITEDIRKEESQLHDAAARTVDGRRAFTNMEARTDYLAQSGFVEVAHNKVLLSVVGGEITEEYPEASRRLLVERFIASIEFADEVVAP